MSAFQKSAKIHKTMATKKTNNQDTTKFQQSKVDKIFYLVKDENDKVNIVVGQYKVTNKTFNSFSAADEYLGHKPYEIIFNLAAICLKTMIDDDNKKTETNNNEKTVIL